MSGEKEAVEVLRCWPREGYARRPLPSARDRSIGELVETLRNEDDVARVARAVATTETVLGSYAERAAALAVRTDDPRHVRAGLRAAALMAANADPRDVVIALALLWRSAEILLLDPHAEFTAVGRALGDYGRPLHAFVRRDPRARLLSAMNYVEVGEGTDFRYECRW
ncbi:hypothetical protein ACN28C_02475 [Plantactinospora sp. WMMC1484]|uniref:hypothetical protein n=1 Tax=Plantactinospora sp. WMMC1484 TaxID=3404122 RepID=UPI003BF55BF1